MGLFSFVILLSCVKINNTRIDISCIFEYQNKQLKITIMKTEIFISMGIQTKLGIYIPSEEIIRSVHNIKPCEIVEGEFTGVVKVQNVFIDVMSNDGKYWSVDTSKI